MPTDVFTILDLDWERFERSRGALVALRRWRRDEPDLAIWPSLPTLMAALKDRHHPDRQDRLFRALLRLCGRDVTAREAVVHAITPALTRLARRYRPLLGEDAASVVLLATLERINRYRADRPGHPGANLVQDVRYTLHRAAYRELAVPPGQPHPLRLDGTVLWALPAAPPSPCDELAMLLDDALDAGYLSPDDEQLIYLTRLEGIPAHQLAAAHGIPASTLRKRRERAEAALAQYATDAA